MVLNFVVPAEFSDPTLYVRAGAVIKELTTGTIVGHIQQVGNLGVGAFNPAFKGLELLINAAQSIQIERVKASVTQVQGTLGAIQHSLASAQLLGSVSALASVASLGVSVAGFSIMFNKLERLETKLDALSEESLKIRKGIAKISGKMDLWQLAILRSKIEQIGMARLLDKDIGRHSLVRAQESLMELRAFYVGLLSSPLLEVVGTQSLNEILDVQERLVAACEAELYADFLLDGSPRTITKRYQNQCDALGKAFSASPREIYERAETGDRQSGVYFSIRPEERAQAVKGYAAIRHESLARLESWPALAATLHERRVSPQDYIESIERMEDGRDLVESPILVLDCRAKGTSSQAL